MGSFNLDGTAPSFTGTSSLTITEGTTTGDAATADERVIYSITGGADAGNVTINPQTGVISVSPAPEFDTPTDADADGVYQVEVTATDIVGYTVTRPMTIKVLEVPFGIVQCCGVFSFRGATGKLYGSTYLSSNRTSNHTSYYNQQCCEFYLT